jgi:hypothetical protein
MKALISSPRTKKKKKSLKWLNQGDLGLAVRLQNIRKYFLHTNRT